MKRSEVIKRALSATKLGIKYKLGAGGMKAIADTPADSKGYCDCSGFSAWCLGFARLTKDPFYLRVAGGWINTDSIVRDARDVRGMFSECPEALALPGDLMVFGKGQGRSYGHVGVISQMRDRRVWKIIHCSPSNEGKGLSAIAETSADVFRKYNAIIACYSGLED